ncbi:MAG: hypothetical protein WCB19_01010 [Thermoplasmata archaeon]
MKSRSDPVSLSLAFLRLQFASETAIVGFLLAELPPPFEVRGLNPPDLRIRNMDESIAFPGNRHAIQRRLVSVEREQGRREIRFWYGSL